LSYGKGNTIYITPVHQFRQLWKKQWSFLKNIS